MKYLSESYSKKPIIVPELQRKINIGNDLRSIVRILKIIQQEKPDIVHTHTAKAGSCARIASFLYNLFSRHKVKTIHTFHGHVFEGYFKKPVSRAFILIERLLSRFTDVIIAISNTQKHELSDKYRITPAHKIKTIQLGFHLNSFLESNRLEHPFRQRFGIDDNTFLIGIVGRLVPIKNHVMFLNVVKIFLQQNPDVNVKFMVIGDGELRSVLEEYCRKEGLSDHVRFCGWVIDVHSVYTDLDILALTSINEGTPVSVIEAMASSVPVIATDVGGIKDLLGSPDGLSTLNGFQTCERGSLCKKNDPESFAHGLQYLMKNGEDKNSQRIIRAKDFVTRHYSHKRLLKEMESLYNDLLCETGEDSYS
jgi:glycosyltransferase involved in cell wall biosynthesis